MGDGKACKCIDAAYSIGAGGDAVKTDQMNNSNISTESKAVDTNSFSQSTNENISH